MAASNTESERWSKYFQSLDTTAQERYEERLNFNGKPLPDPYSNRLKGWCEDVKSWPVVEYGDIYHYLINTPGQYTREKMKAMKSLDGYNYFVSGHVQTCAVLSVGEDSPICFLKTKVAPSQRANDKPHEPWVSIDKVKGGVISAHCTCKAGLGETCSHIAALLFKFEAIGRLRVNSDSKTSEACTWNRSFRKKVTPKRIVDMDFTKPKHGKSARLKVNQPRPHQECKLDEEEKQRFLKELRRICPSAGCLTKGDSDTDSASEDEDLPPLLNRPLPQEAHNEGEMQWTCDAFVQDFLATPQQCQNLETMTRAQNNSLLWKRHREGRVTATVAHDILTLKPQTAPLAVINKVMKREQSNLSHIESVAFGLRYEGKAKEEYKREMECLHEQFQLRECGLVVDSRFPLFAASPDGVRTCACHSEGLVEVKCSFKHRDLHVKEIPDIDATFYLEKGTLKLKSNHRYYSQVQFQMYVANKKYCDFVVYTNQGIHCQTVLFDQEFVDKLVVKCTAFCLNHIVPEVIEQKFAR